MLYNWTLEYKIKINRAFASSWAKDQEPGKALDDNVKVEKFL